jgi:hypothetical protein
MFRAVVVAFVLSCCVTTAWAQTQPAPAAAPGTPPAKPAARKSATKSKTAIKPAGPSEACDLGVIAAAGNPIGWKKVGLTMFGNEYSELPADAWGIDDLVFSRVRAAAGTGVTVRRIAYARDAFDSYNHPEKRTISDAKESFVAIVRQIAANSRCARYMVVTRTVGSLAGTNQSLTGIGVYTHGPFGKAAVFAFIRIVVFDGQTFTIREDPLGNFGARMSAALSRVAKDDTIRHAGGAEFPASPEEAGKDSKLRDAARALLVERLDNILPAYLKE